jgi:hypothetical protein
VCRSFWLGALGKLGVTSRPTRHSLTDCAIIGSPYSVYWEDVCVR